MSYQAAGWHLWRDHRVFVPYATVPNWVEAAGKKVETISTDYRFRKAQSNICSVRTKEHLEQRPALDVHRS